MAVEIRDFCWVVKRAALESKSRAGLPGLVWALHDHLDVTVW